MSTKNSEIKNKQQQQQKHAHHQDMYSSQYTELNIFKIKLRDLDKKNK